ncbi:MAG: hypothetical protein U0359_40105 [Byssovorax sp.]
MRKLALLPAAALFFAVAPLAQRLGPVPSALLLVGLALMLAAGASGALSAASLGAGALAAFPFGLLAPLSPALAGAALLTLAYAERLARVRTRPARLAHLALGLAAGALAGAATSAYAAAPLALRAVAVTVAAVLTALPLLIDADDPLAHALDGLASELKGPAEASLREGASLRRSVEGQPLDRKARAEVEQTWAALLRLGETRAQLERTRIGAPSAPAAKGRPTAAEAVRSRLDARITEHVAALTRAYLAADAARAAELSLDDGALRRTDAMGESLEHVSRAIVDEV